LYFFALFFFFFLEGQCSSFISNSVVVFVAEDIWSNPVACE